MTNYRPIFPNIFTFGNIFCGFLSIISAAEGEPTQVLAIHRVEKQPPAGAECLYHPPDRVEVLGIREIPERSPPVDGRLKVGRPVKFQQVPLLEHRRWLEAATARSGFPD